jgi:hypothetical protein
MKHSKVQHRKEPHNEGRILFYYPGFSRAGAGPETVVTTLPRSPNSELEPMESAKPQTAATRHEQQPQRQAAAADIPFATAEIGRYMGQTYWRAFAMEMDTFIKANCTAQVIPSAQTIAEEVLRPQQVKQVEEYGTCVSRER